MTVKPLMVAPDEAFSQVLQQVFAAAPLGMAIFDAHTCRFQKVNAATSEMLGYEASELVRMTLLDLMIGGEAFQRKNCRDFFRPGKGTPRPLEQRFLSKQGEAVWVNLYITEISTALPDQRPVLAVLENITQRKKAELALEVEEFRYRTLVSNLPGAVYRLIPQVCSTTVLPQDSDWFVEFVSEGIADISGFTADELIGADQGFYVRLIHSEDRLRVAQTIWDALIQQMPFQMEYRLYAKDGQLRWVLDRGQAIWDNYHRLKQLDGVLLDITDLKTTEAQLAYRTSHDTLTGLPNRALFFKHLDRALQQNQLNRAYQFAVLMLDVDNFRLINDSMGHFAGDQLLLEVATRLRTCLRPNDFIARLGGDEFAVHLNGIAGLTDVAQVADRIQQVMKQPFEIKELPIAVTISIGITLQNRDSMVIYHQAHDMLRDAEIAMYRAKQYGKSQFALYDISMHERAIERLQIETELRRACDRNDFIVYYQPIINLQTGMLAGFEALVRWQPPGQNVVTPDTFIPIAEETGLILAIDNFVLVTACQQMVAWQNQWPRSEPIFLSVNLSTRHFTQPNLVEQVWQILETTGFTPSLLKLEITESVLLEQSQSTYETLQALSELGIKISLDDFGTGYSSLSYIHQFPMHTLKIDRSFIANLQQRSESNQIVRAILAMARSLNLDVVAEGIETCQQADSLQSMECQYGQGYWFAKPLNYAATEELLRASAIL